RPEMVERIVSKLHCRQLTRPGLLGAMQLAMVQPFPARDMEIDRAQVPGQMENILGDEAGIATAKTGEFSTRQLAKLREIQRIVQSKNEAISGAPVDQIPVA